MECSATQQTEDNSEEQRFLEAYRMEDYFRPSLAVDIAAFTLSDSTGGSRSGEKKLSLLLIRRGEHPFLHAWALPGGFLRRTETLEACAEREIREETSLSPAALMPVRAFSRIDRDPRGRVVTQAFAAVMGGEEAPVIGGDDAADARWFTVTFEEGTPCRLTLTCGEIVLAATLRCTGRRFRIASYEVLDSGGLAFDHAQIIATAICMLRSNAKDFDFIFDFLPETFTLTQLQRVQETVLHTSLQPADFRRRILPHVEATGEMTSGESHRPAKLYRKKPRSN